MSPSEMEEQFVELLKRVPAERQVQVLRDLVQLSVSLRPQAGVQVQASMAAARAPAWALPESAAQ